MLYELNAASVNREITIVFVWLTAVSRVKSLKGICSALPPSTGKKLPLEPNAEYWEKPL